MTLGGRYQPSSRQTGALLLLLILVPLIPTAVLVRMMYEVVHAEQEATDERIRDLYRQSLAMATAALAGHPLEGPDRSGEVRRFYERTVDPFVRIRLVESAQTTTGDVIAEAPLDGVMPGWKVQLLPGDRDQFKASVWEQVTIYRWVAAGAVGLNLLIAGLAAVTVRRQLQLHELKSHSLATLSHELKTPLASMRLLLDTLGSGRATAPAQVAEYVHLISHEAERLERLAGNFLALARMERGLHAFKKARTTVAEIVDSAVEAVGPKLRENVRFARRVDEGLPPLFADSEALVMALTNLLENAVKYTAEPKEISLQAEANGSSIAFVVADNGIGISPDEQRRIFRRFYQADQKLSRTREGCGLGLSIVKHIAEAHHGSIGVESEPGKGSVFTLRIPVGTPAR